jgi:DNA-binding MltR family transcriptional regulator
MLYKDGLVKIKDNPHDFVSLTQNKELWEEVVNSSDRNAVLIAGAAFDTLLERLLKRNLIQDSAVSKKIAESSIFASKINLCFSLGLISEDENHDLNLLRDIRNAFAHNIFGCDFSNDQVKNAVSNLILPRKARATPENATPKGYFNIGMVVLDNFLSERVSEINTIIKRSNMRFASEA